MFCPLCNEKLVKAKQAYNNKPVMFCPASFEWQTVSGSISSHYEIYNILNIELIYIKPFYVTNDLNKNITRIYAFSDNLFYTWKFISQSDLIESSTLQNKLLKLIKFI